MGDSVFVPLQNHLRCVFNSIVIRNTAISEKYPGGVVKFTNKYPTRRNHLITVGSFMGLEVVGIVHELKGYGFIPKEDFLLVDAGLYQMVGQGYFPLEFESIWLEGHYENGGVYVRHIEGAPKTATIN
jgi:hypothetical protein